MQDQPPQQRFFSALNILSIPLSSSDRVTFPKRGDSFFNGPPEVDLPARTPDKFSRVICRRHVH